MLTLSQLAADMAVDATVRRERRKLGGRIQSLKSTCKPSRLVKSSRDFDFGEVSHAAVLVGIVNLITS